MEKSLSTGLKYKLFFDYRSQSGSGFSSLCLHEKQTRILRNIFVRTLFDCSDLFNSLSLLQSDDKLIFPSYQVFRHSKLKSKAAQRRRRLQLAKEKINSGRFFSPLSSFSVFIRMARTSLLKLFTLLATCSN